MSHDFVANPTTSTADEASFECDAQVFARYPLCPEPKMLPTRVRNRILICDYDITKDLVYMPEPEVLYCARYSSTNWKSDVSVMRSRWNQLQKLGESENEDPKCEQLHTDHVAFPKWHAVKWGSHGHGANMLQLVYNIGNHFDRGIPVVPSRTKYRFGSENDECGGRGWSCYMSPLVPKKCEMHRINPESIVDMDRRKMSESKNSLLELCLPHGKLDVSYGRCVCESGYYPFPTSRLEFNGCAPLEKMADRPKDEKKWQIRTADFDSKNSQDKLVAIEHHWLRAGVGELFPSANPFSGDSDPAHRPFDERDYSAAADLEKAYGLTEDYPKSELKYLDHPSNSQSQISLHPTLQPKRNTVKSRYGWFWWWSQHLYWLHYRAPKLESHIKPFIPPILSPSVGVHVRRGDSCHDNTAKHRKCPPLKRFLQKIIGLEKKYNIRYKTVYVATDDDAALIEAERVFSPRLVVYQKFSREKYQKEDIDNNRLINDEETLKELYVDVWALAQTDAFVGDFASSLGGMVYGMSLSMKGYYPPFASVGLPWGHERLGGHHADQNVYDRTYRHGIFENDA